MPLSTATWVVISGGVRRSCQYPSPYPHAGSFARGRDGEEETGMTFDEALIAIRNEFGNRRRDLRRGRTLLLGGPESGSPVPGYVIKYVRYVG